MNLPPKKRPYERTVQEKDFELGNHLGTVKSAPFGCPVCVRSTKTGSHRMDVFENGVRWSCGCIVDLPPLHRQSNAGCSICNPHPTNVVDFVQKYVA